MKANRDHAMGTLIHCMLLTGTLVMAGHAHQLHPWPKLMQSSEQLHDLHATHSIMAQGRRQSCWKIQSFAQAHLTQLGWLPHPFLGGWLLW